MPEWIKVKEFSAKPQGYVWLVSRREGSNTRYGYFKFALKENRFYSGPMEANELIAAALARHLGLPVADLEPAEIDGRRGIVSVVQEADELRMWKDMPAEFHGDLKAHLANFPQLVKAMVFDIWTCNIDRSSGKNIIVYRDRQGDPYRFYLIDHGHALHGSYYKWSRGRYDQPYWDDIWRHYHLPDGLNQAISGYSQLRPYIEAIQKIDRRLIIDAVASVPRGFLNPPEAALIRRILFRRQKRLAWMIKRWIRHRSRIKQRRLKARLSLKKGHANR